jgi:hypothetical protein
MLSLPKLLVALLILLLIACSKKHSPAPVLPPARALLTAPLQNAVCTTGTVISDTNSSILFTWDATDNTDSYDLVLKNLLTSATITQSTTVPQLTVAVTRNTPYSWYIVSKSIKTSTTAQSDTWRFYNSGPGIITYPPYPAEITAPTFGETVTAASGTINLTWTGSSVITGTIVNYDVYFGSTVTPPKLKSAITDSFVSGVLVASGATYYWKVITRDRAGNTSDSGVYQFTVN